MAPETVELKMFWAYERCDDRGNSEIVFRLRDKIDGTVIARFKDSAAALNHLGLLLLDAWPQPPDPNVFIQSANGNQCCPSCGTDGPCECPELP